MKLASPAFLSSAAGRSYAEIGESLGISKQAAHKAATSAMTQNREQLAAQGFAGLDSKGFLQTASRASPPCEH